MKRVGLVLSLIFVIISGVLYSPNPSANAQDEQPTIPPTNTPRGTPYHSPTPSATHTATATPTATNTITPSPTNTATHTETVTASPTATTTATNSPTATATSTETLTATPTPTEEVVSGIPPTPTIFYPPNFTPEPQITAIPTAMPRLLPRAADNSQYEVINVVLIGTDSESIDQAEGVFRTDVMIVVNINLTTQTVSMLSLPRDLYVWIAQWQMQRLNLAWGRGEAIGWTDGGWGLFRQTVLYNFGIELHYYAVVDFSGFKEIIDTLGGVTVAVDCPIQDYLLVGYDDAEEPIFELTTLPVGVHTLDSTEALWYSRSRRGSIEFDRGRRQQQVLRAIFNQSRDGGILTDLPNLWTQMNETVDTNLPLTAIVELLPLALQLEPNDIENHFFRSGNETRGWQTPSGDSVQLPNPAMITLVQNFLTPPTENRVVADAARIEIYDGSGTNAQWDSVATNRLLWEGLLAAPMGEYEEVIPETIIIDYSGSTKGSSLESIVGALNINPNNLEITPDPDRTSDFVVILGEDYNSCVDRQINEFDLDVPPATPTARP